MIETLQDASTGRKPIPDKHLARDKALIRLERELNRLHRVQIDAPVVPLERPYQRGWVKYFVLRRDVLRRPDAPAFQLALAKVNQRACSRERSFVRRDGRAIGLHPRIIPTREWRALGWTAKVQRLFVFGCWRVGGDDDVPRRFRRFTHGYKVASEWWLEEEVQPNLITHRRVELPLVRERIAEIESYFEKRNAWPRLSWLHGRRNWHNESDPRLADLRAELATGELADELEG